MSDENKRSKINIDDKNRNLKKFLWGANHNK